LEEVAADGVGDGGLGSGEQAVRGEGLLVAEVPRRKGCLVRAEGVDVLGPVGGVQGLVEADGAVGCPSGLKVHAAAVPPGEEGGTTWVGGAEGAGVSLDALGVYTVGLEGVAALGRGGVAVDVGEAWRGVG
jgi:hypothetical protein